MALTRVVLLNDGESTRLLWRGSFGRLTILLLRRAAPSKSSAAIALDPNSSTLVDEGAQRRPTTSAPTDRARQRELTFPWDSDLPES